MTEDEAHPTTLAHTKSPKTARRTTFQDELDAAVSARASRHKTTGRFSYSDDFDDDEDDIFEQLLQTRKKRMETFKSGKTKANINVFKMSDDEEENIKPKRVSFLKTKKKNSPEEDEQLRSSQSGKANTPDSEGSHNVSSSDPHRSSRQHQSRSSISAASRQDSLVSSQSEQGHAESLLPSESPLARKRLSETHVPLNSENSQLDSALRLPSEDSQRDSRESPLPLSPEKEEAGQGVVIRGEGEPPVPQPRERHPRPRSSVGQVEGGPPRPKPRQRAVIMVEGEESAETQRSRAAATPVPQIVASDGMAPSSPASGERRGSRDDSAQAPGEAQFGSPDFSTHPSLSAEHGSLPPEVSHSSVSKDLVASDERKEENCSTSFVEYQPESEDQLDRAVSRPSHATDKSSDQRPSSSQSSRSRKSKSACSYTAESKYLGSLKVLDQRMCPQGSPPEAADSLRAAVYQEWLKKKEESLQVTMQRKKQEDKLKEEKKNEEMRAKKADAKASYEAWRAKKGEVIRDKAKAQQEALRKLQRETEEKEDKKETAKRVFEKWKREHDKLLRERFRKQKETENKLKQKQDATQQEKREDCSSAFSKWDEAKQNNIKERMRSERRKEKIREVEEKYEKEEREKMAVEMYEKWLRRKECKQKLEWSERKIQAILQDAPPPPWSPPNRTVPFGK